jgi:hypothetical protein
LRVTKYFQLRCVLGPESDLLEDLDAAGFGEALTKALRSALLHPAIPVRASLQLWSDLTRIPIVAGSRWFGVDTAVAPDPKDRRFADPAWSSNPAFYAVRQGTARSTRIGTQAWTWAVENWPHAAANLEWILPSLRPGGPAARRRPDRRHGR